MNFYFNIDENMCADEQWVANYLYEMYPERTVEEHLEGLHTRRIWGGWYSCAISPIVWETLDKSGIYHSNPAGWGA